MSNTLEKQAETIIGKVLELPQAERQAAAARACGGNAELLGRVTSLLLADAQAGGFMDATADAHANMASVAPIGEKPGDTIGRYKLLEKIGEGGFGVVFTAEQQVPVRRLVALKIIKLGMDTREVVARFEAERQALAMMDHPNIAKVLDAGSTDTGRPYFVMELVRGSLVTEYADKHKLSTRDRVALASQICRAVQHAHSKGIIHRDLKPSNVLITVTDDKPVPKVIDFGIAKATQARLTDMTLYTSHRQLIGTPQYMSPEQADSDGSDIDTRTDIYSLGVLLYELLIGATPVDAKHLRSVAFDAMRKLIVETDVPRPATRLLTLAAESQVTIASARSTDVKKLSQLVQGELDWIVMKALEKDRTRRYDTASAMADDLNLYLAGEAVSAGPVSGTYRLRKSLMRHRAAAAIGCAIAACLLLGVVGTTWGLLQEKKAKQHAVEQEHKAVEARDDANRQRLAALAAQDNTQAVVSFLTEDVLGSAMRPTQATNSRQVLAMIMKPAEQAIGSRFKDHPIIEAAVRQAMGDSLLAIGAPKEAIPELQRALEIRKVKLGPDAQDTLTTEASFADAQASVGNLADAKPRADRAWHKLISIAGPDERVTLSAEAVYARILVDSKEGVKALPLFKHAWEGNVRLLGMPDPKSMARECDYAQALIIVGQPAAAAPLAEEAYWEARRTIGFGPSLTYRALNLWSDAADAAGFVKTTDVTCGFLEQYHGMGYSPDPAERWAAVWQRHALALLHEGQYAQAAVYFRKVANSQTVKPDPDRVALSTKQALDCDRLAANPPATAPVLAREDSAPEDAPQTLVKMESGADAEQHIQNWAIAADQYHKVIALRRKSAQPDLRALADDLWELSRCTEQLGNLGDAANQMHEATDCLCKLSGISDPNTVSVAQQTADLMDRAGRKTDADAVRKTFGLNMP